MKQGLPSIMDRRLKERLVGATILVVLIVLIVPELLSGPRHPAAAVAPASGGPVEPVRNVTVDLATSKATAADPAAAASSSLQEPMPPGGESAPVDENPPPATAAPLPPEHAAGPNISTLRAQQPESGAVENDVPHTMNGAVPAKPGSGRDTATAEASRHGWSVQIGSFASRANAENQMRHVKPHDAAVYLSSAGRGPTLRYRVRIGAFADRAAAERELAKLRKEGQSASLVPP